MMMMVVIDYGDSAESKFYLAPFELLLAKVFIIQGLSRIFLPVPCKKVEAQMERDKIYFQPSHHSSSSSSNISSRVDSRELPECEEAFSCSPYKLYYNKSMSLLTISLVHSVPCADSCSRIHCAEMLLVFRNLKVAHFKIFIHPKCEENRKNQA